MRSYGTKVLRSAIKTYPIIFWIPTHDSTLLSNKARIFACINRLFVVDMAGIEQCSVSNEEFLEEVAWYDVSTTVTIKIWKTKPKRLTARKKSGRNLSVAEAEVLETDLKLTIYSPKGKPILTINSLWADQKSGKGHAGKCTFRSGYGYLKHLSAKVGSGQRKNSNNNNKTLRTTNFKIRECLDWAKMFH